MTLGEVYGMMLACSADISKPEGINQFVQGVQLVFPAMERETILAMPFEELLTQIRDRGEQIASEADQLNQRFVAVSQALAMINANGR